MPLVRNIGMYLPLPLHLHLHLCPFSFSFPSLLSLLSSPSLLSLSLQKLFSKKLSLFLRISSLAVPSQVAPPMSLENSPHSEKVWPSPGEKGEPPCGSQSGSPNSLRNNRCCVLLCCCVVCCWVVRCCVVCCCVVGCCSLLLVVVGCCWLLVVVVCCCVAVWEIAS